MSWPRTCRPERDLPVTGFGTLLIDRGVAGNRVALSANASHRQRVASLHPGCLTPGDPDGPAEPEPPQQVHRIGPLRRHGSTRCLQILQERCDRGHGIASGIDHSDRLPQVATGVDRAHPGHDQRRQTRSSLMGGP